MSVVAYLGEANVVGLLPEALTADVQAVLADETSWVRADTANRKSAHYIPILPQFLLFMCVFSSNITYHSLEPLP